MRIFLLGFMGAGKSFLAQRLSDAVSWPWIDLDQKIEDQTGQSIPQIFAEKGEAHFRELEANTLRETSQIKTPLIVATGGGVPCFNQNMAWMNQNGMTIYLKAPIWLLQKRLISQTANRPLLAQKTPDELSKFIEEKLKEREVFYSKSQVIFYLQGDEKRNLKDFIAFMSGYR